MQKSASRHASLAIDESAATRHIAPMVEWIESTGLTGYEDAVAFMEARVAAIHRGEADEAVWLVEHPPLYTAGTSARAQDLLDARFPVHETGRGGQFTYHGPGQRIVYVMLDLNRRGRDVRAFVANLEAWVIAALAEFGIRGEIREGRVGVWVPRPDRPPLFDGTPREDKIAAIGVKLRRWVSFHGHLDQPGPGPVALRRDRALRDQRARRHQPCRSGLPVEMGDLDVALRKGFDQVFG